jgi:hypothetical protein
MREVFRARQHTGRTQVQYQLEEEDYAWMLYNLRELMEDVKSTGAEVTIAAKAMVDTGSDPDSAPFAPPQPNPPAPAAGYETVEYLFSVRINVPAE